MPPHSSGCKFPARRADVPAALGSSVRFDTLESFIQPAKVQVLVVPVHPIKRATFERHVQLVKQYATVPLADVPPDRRGERGESLPDTLRSRLWIRGPLSLRDLVTHQGLFGVQDGGTHSASTTAGLTLLCNPCTAIFSATPGSSGSLLFDFVTPETFAPLRPLSFLAELQTHRRVQGIIGVLDASEYTARSLEVALAAFQASLTTLPKTFATKLYGFDASAAQVEQARGLKESDGLAMVPSQGDVGFYLKTFLAEFAGGILWEFSNMVRPAPHPPNWSRLSPIAGRREL